MRCVLDLKNPADNCNPNIVWSGTPSGDSYFRGNLNSGSFTVSAGTSTYARGVRCVPDLNRKLQLCDYYSGYGTIQCSSKSSGCTGANNNNCWPNHVWSGTLRSSDYYSGFQLNRGAIGMTGACDGTGKCISTNAFGVRCVPDLNKNITLNF